MKKKILIPMMIATMICTSACGNSATAAVSANETAAEDEVRVKVIDNEDDSEYTPSAGVKIVEEDGEKYIVYKTPSALNKERIEFIRNTAQKAKSIAKALLD